MNNLKLMRERIYGSKGTGVVQNILKHIERQNKIHDMDDRSNVKEHAYRQYERGNRNPPIQVLSGLSATYHFSINYLLNDSLYISDIFEILDNDPLIDWTGTDLEDDLLGFKTPSYWSDMVIVEIAGKRVSPYRDLKFTLKMKTLYSNDNPINTDEDYIELIEQNTFEVSTRLIDKSEVAIKIKDEFYTNNNYRLAIEKYMPIGEDKDITALFITK